MYSKCSRCNKRYFKLEENLRKKLLKPTNLWEIEERIKLYGGIIQKTEFSLIGGNRIDLLCFKTPELIVIEFYVYMNNITIFILPIIIKNAFISINIVSETVESWIGERIITSGNRASCS